MSNTDLKIEVAIPFEGFYESSYDDIADFWYLDLLIDDYHSNRDNLIEKFYESMNFSAFHDDIAKEYVKCFNELCKESCGIDLSLEFKEMFSPKEYNFSTNRIFCYMPYDKLVELKNKLVIDNLVKEVKERHTSRSGYFSHYSSDWNKWQDKELKEFDCNMIETMLFALLSQNNITLFSGELRSYDLLDSFRGNGGIDTLVEKHCDQKFFDYFDSLAKDED